MEKSLFPVSFFDSDDPYPMIKMVEYLSQSPTKSSKKKESVIGAFSKVLVELLRLCAP